MGLARKKPGRAAAATLDVAGLSVARGGRLVLADVSFTLSPGGAIALTGPNGAGKSTLLRALCGLLPPESGRVSLTGGDPDATVGEQTHYLGHADGLKTALTAAENVAVAAALLGGRATDPEAPLAAVGMAPLADLPVTFLSAGQRRRVALARLLAVPRPLWLLDEPTVALDAAAVALLTQLMATHLGEGGLLIAATHVPLDLPEIREMRLAP